MGLRRNSVSYLPEKTPLTIRRIEEEEHFGSPSGVNSVKAERICASIVGSHKGVNFFPRINAKVEYRRGEL